MKVPGCIKNKVGSGLAALLIAMISLFLFSGTANTMGFGTRFPALPVGGDTSVAAYISAYFAGGGNKAKLDYPEQVRNFYAADGGHPAWIKPEKAAAATWEAMLLLDCVNQYGLNHADYHPAALSYDRLHTMIEQPAKVANSEKARYDIMLTDALLAFINNLHYGKLNPTYSQGRIDSGVMIPFHADSVLSAAIGQKDFRTAVLNAQPQGKEYKNMQYEMHLLKGVYQGDCYQIPDSEVRKIAINMERLRWAAINTGTWVQVNIPSFTLKFHCPDSVYEFKVIVGKTTAPTPQLASAITYLTTSPDWKVPHKIFVKEILPAALKDAAYLESRHYSIYDSRGNYLEPRRALLLKIARNPAGYSARQSAGCDNALGQVVFRFNNPYSIYLHDTPAQSLFQRDVRAFSHSCIRVERAGELAALMLKYSGSQDKLNAFNKAFNARLTRNISLKTAVPIVVTYLTCEVRKGEVNYYPDIYHLDRSLEMELYNATDQQLSMR